MAEEVEHGLHEQAVHGLGMLAPHLLGEGF